MPLPAPTIRVSAKRQWLYATVVLVLLAAAQLLSQLHSLEHLNDIDGSGHSDVVCMLCVVSADLENSHTTAGMSPTTVFPANDDLSQISWTPRFSSFVPRYSPRAPPTPA